MRQLKLSIGNPVRCRIREVVKETLVHAADRIQVTALLHKVQQGVPCRTDAWVARLNELRLGIEPVAAQLAARNASPQQRRELLRLAERLSELETTPSPRVGEELETDLQFHTLILEASGNEMFVALTPPIMDIMSGRALYGIMPDDPHVDTMQIHVDLAQAISSGDADAAEDASRRLLRGVNDFMEM